MVKRVLVFPGGMPKSLEYLSKLLAQGEVAIGASSLAYDNSRDKYSTWEFLPFITDEDFSVELAKLLNAHQVNEIYTPNLVVWNYLSTELAHIAPSVKLANVSPIDEVLSGYRLALCKARRQLASPISLPSVQTERTKLSDIELAGLFRYAELIPGMCDDDKLCALIEIVRYAVDGDVVEIGTWWGKSAFVLARLAQAHRIGNVLCVDPWEDALLVQDEKIVDSGSASISASEALDVFKIGMLPLAAGGLNYLRLPSVAAAQVYQQGRVHETEEFGKTTYAGRIAILHIDGNHAYASVRGDVDAWVDCVLPGAWIILDDYIWPYGNGPKLVGDDMLLVFKERISVSFVMGTALFIQLK
nr:class I SAM-dependent methyltransferase [uncultured Undibacterium sp.]